MSVDNPERPTTPRDRLSLKAATRRLVTQTGGPESLSIITRVQCSGLSKYYSLSETEQASFMPVDIMLDAEKDIVARSNGDIAPPLLSECAAQLGYALVLIPTTAAPASLHTLLSHIAAEAGDVVSKGLLALEDGTISPKEQREIIQEIEEVEAPLRQLRQQLKGEGR